MGEPTRDDLRVSVGPALNRHVTDEELEPIIRSLGYVKIGTPIVAVDSPAFARAVRERVNPTCPDCEGSGYYEGHGHVCDGSGQPEACYGAGCPFPCSRCDGRGHLGPRIEDLPSLIEAIESGGIYHEREPLSFLRALLDLLGEEE